MVGDYAAWNYFQRLPGEVNRAFVDRFRRRYGPNRVTDDPIEAAYVGVLLWAQAVTDAGSPEPEGVRREIRGQSLLAPGGLVYVDGENQHTWKAVRLGRIRRDGQFDIVWDSRKPVRPIPYPVFRDREEWDRFLDDLHRGWGGRWENPER
jgi:urea transport system substrate-binding protein